MLKWLPWNQSPFWMKENQVILFRFLHIRTIFCWGNTQEPNLFVDEFFPSIFLETHKTTAVVIFVTQHQNFVKTRRVALWFFLWSPCYLNWVRWFNRKFSICMLKHKDRSKCTSGTIAIIFVSLQPLWSWASSDFSLIHRNTLILLFRNLK